ncbi:hypothetical protein Pint_08451 [Pistacia integerrima]|uniref:Uncharacterized protein n=1 Tax=Pistacia integerrima TaxID=434235 RepID=A0ACC0XZ03_9ROSI|nr:hypothetical protein Pint_08451 [Pistacia integerrima]
MLKTKAEIEEIVRAESEVGSLQQKLDDLGVQLNQQLQKNHGSTGDSGNQLQQTSAKLRDKKRDAEASAPSHVSERSTSKDICLDGAAESNNHERKRESTSKPNKNSSQNQQLESTNNSNSKPAAPSNSKKSGSKVEGSNSSSLSLTKLTTRLNFLKERRSQIASELQNIRGSGQAVRSQDKSRGSEAQNTDKSQGSGIGREGDNSQSLQNVDKREGQSQQKPEKFRKSNSHSVQNVDGGRRSEGQRQYALERGRSEGHVNYDGEQSQGPGGQSVTPSRTYSR